MAGKSDVYLCFIPCYHMAFVEHNAVCPRKGDDVDVYMCICVCISLNTCIYLGLSGLRYLKVT